MSSTLCNWPDDVILSSVTGNWPGAGRMSFGSSSTATGTAALLVGECGANSGPGWPFGRSVFMVVPRGVVVVERFHRTAGSVPIRVKVAFPTAASIRVVQVSRKLRTNWCAAAFCVEVTWKMACGGRRLGTPRTEVFLSLRGGCRLKTAYQLHGML